MDFRNKVYKIVREIPKGRVSTYKQIGNILKIKAYRAIGQVLKTNPLPIEIPCHRVVKNNGEIGGYFGKTTGPKLREKIKLLKNEGVEISGKKIKNFEKIKI